MYQISNEKFGLFVTELRKKKNLTQKDLAEKLYVSDKTVSKWERGLSMPNVVLLIPIADILDVTVTELLRGEKIDTQKNIDTKEVEELVVGSLDMAVRNSIHQHRKNCILAYLLCFLISITEIIMLVVSGNSIAEMKDDILLVTGLMLLFGAWFCFFAKDILPTYYDANKINYVSQGIFRIHLVGLSFNNGNWMYICTTLKIWTLATVVLYPLAGLLPIYMPMTHDAKELEENHAKGAKALEACLDQGKNVVFLTLGDPCVYSTFSYLQHRVEADGYHTELVSGITSFCAAAARLNISLSEWNEQLHIVPAVHRLDSELTESGNYILMKSGKKMNQVKEILAKSGRDVLMVENCGMPEEHIYHGVEEIPDDAGYYSLIIAKEHK